ncbi:MAG: hypothetical protein WDM76_16420 [Limisphaerales bacterium]
MSGYVGSGLVNSFLGGDPSTGTLTSPPFVITSPFINFLIGGGTIPGQECMNLITSNVVVKTATGWQQRSINSAPVGRERPRRANCDYSNRGLGHRRLGTYLC